MFTVSQPKRAALLCLISGLSGCQGELAVGSSRPDHNSQAQSIRAALRGYLFGQDALPSAPPDGIEPDVMLEGFEDLGPALRLHFDLDYGARATVHVLEPAPARPINRLLLINGGHQPLVDLKEATAAFLQHGFTVALLPMPLYSPNAGNLRVTIGAQEYQLDRHSDLAKLDDDGHRTLHLFFEPVSRAFTHLLKERSWQQVAMAGISGGGWTTDVYKALDERLDVAYSISGSIPFHIQLASERGDFEQHKERGLYEIAGYRQLYLLGALGSKHRQVLLESDPCCFAWGERREQIEAYEEVINSQLALSEQGGEFQVALIPDQTEHKISPEVIEWIRENADAALNGP